MRRTTTNLLLILTALGPFSIDSFVGGRVGGGRANIKSTTKPRKISTFNSSSSMTSSIKMSTREESTILHQVTTKVGKSASTIVSVSFFLLLAYQRDAIILTLWIGSILNAIASKIAKKVLNHERPAELQDSDKIKLKPSDGGMPSSHAMSLSFIGTSSILGGVIPPEYRLVTGLVMIIYAATALRYRVRDHLHTVDQVAVGVVLGLINALAWLKFAVGSSDNVGAILSYVQKNWVSAETGLFPYSALSIPIVVGILVVGSFERRIVLWMKNKSKEE